MYARLKLKFIPDSSANGYPTAFQYLQALESLTQLIQHFGEDKYYCRS